MGWVSGFSEPVVSSTYHNSPHIPAHQVAPPAPAPSPPPAPVLLPDSQDPPRFHQHFLVAAVPPSLNKMYFTKGLRTAISTICSPPLKIYYQIYN